MAEDQVHARSIGKPVVEIHYRQRQHLADGYGPPHVLARPRHRTTARLSLSLSDAGERDVVDEIGRPNAWNLDVLWRNEFRNTVQMMLYADTGELVFEDAPKIELLAERGDARSLSWISRRERNGLERRLVPVQRWGCSCARASAAISTSRRGGGRSRAYS